MNFSGLSRFKAGFNALILSLVSVLIWGALFAPVAAATYQIPAELKVEIRENQRIASENPNASTYFELAMSYAYTGQIEKGWITLRQIPNYDKHYAPKVVAKYQSLIKDQPKEWKYRFKIAFGYYFLEKKPEAIAAFKDVLSIDPNNVWAMGFIALLESELGHVQEGITWCKRALVIEPNATAIHFLLAQGYYKTGDYMGAISEGLTVGRLKAAERRDRDR